MKERKLGISVGDILSFEVFAAVKVAAGAKGLERRLEQVKWGTPQNLDKIQEGEFLFLALRTSGDQQKLEKLLPSLEAKGLAGVGVQLKEGLSEISGPIREIADRLGFPILQFPAELPILEALQSLVSEIFRVQTALFNRSEEIHNEFMAVMLEGGSLNQVAQVLGSFLKKEVLIVDKHFEALSPLSPAWEKWLAVINRASIKESEALKKLEGEKTAWVMPLLAAGSRLGYLLIRSGPAADLAVLDEIALERAATVATLDIIYRRALNEIERRFRNEFVIDLVEGAIPSREIAEERARANNWAFSETMRVFVIRLADLRVQGQKDKFLSYLRANLSIKCICGELGRDIILISPAGEKERDVVGWLKRHLPQLENLADSKLLVGIGRSAGAVREIKASYQQARRTVDNAQRIETLVQIV
ncbi:MAG: hypothetical protein GX335_03855, partial [Firmicutes bacterium]|nr:hypothetical protein [Bacillota bacterium]